MMRATLSAMGALFLMSAAVVAKPPELPRPADGDGRVPVYPDGDRYREPAPDAQPSRNSTKSNATPPVVVSPPFDEWWPMTMPLLLLPIDL
jgi:hypothetical protein